MHITLFAFGSWGDVRPLVVLGKGLQAKGHEVQIVALKDYEEWVRARNLRFFPLTADVQKLINDLSSDVYNPIQQIQIARKMLPPIFAQMGSEVLEATRDSDALLTVEFSLSVLLGVIEVNNLKTIVINPAPLTPTRAFASAASPKMPRWFPSPALYNRLSYGFAHRAQWMLTRGSRKELRRKHPELPQHTFSEFQKIVLETPTLTIVSPQVVPRPDDWKAHQQVTGYLFDDDPEWTPPQALADFLAGGDAPVYIGFGSMPDTKAEATTRLLIDAVQQSGKRAIILTGWAGLGMNDVPESIHILKYAPHNWLFPRMAAVVHHGGAGTTAAGFRAGVPTVIVAHNADQPYWGRLVQQLGVGTDLIPRGKLHVENLAQAIRTATTSAIMRENAQALSEKIQGDDGLATAVEWVEHFLL